MDPVDVIVPVYDGFEEVQDCLESLLAAQPGTPADYVVINDASPNADIRAYLEELAAADRITLLENEINRGFVRTVNRGMARSPDRDVVLLNSDTIVSGDWLDRLKAAAEQARDVGSVTPFSNNAEICSFPRLCRDNPMLMDPADVDRVLARSLAGQQLTIPTAVGYCMYIRRDCLRDVGEFDAGTFGRGYGEENDFCMRARARGWRHVLAANCFVAHVGGVSFSGDKQALVEKAMSVLDQRYPRYHGEIAEFIQADPPYALRCKGFIDCLREDPRLKVLALTHHLGGGTEKHVRELADSADARALLLVLRPFRGKVLRLTLGVEEDYPGLNFDWTRREDRDALFQLLRYVGVGRLHIHHLLDLDAVVEELLDALSLPFDLTLHDYYMIDGNPTLTDASGLFQPDRGRRGRGCNSARVIEDGDALKQWQAAHQRLFDGARRVFAPSAAALALHQEVYRLPGAVVAGHADLLGVDSLPVAASSLSPARPLRVLVLGALGLEKGADLLEQTAVLAKRHAAPLEFRLLGYAYRSLSSVTTLGAYSDGDIDALIAEQGADLVWFPCRWPETYSYTLSAALRCGLPLVVPDIGSFPERVAGRPLTWVLPFDNPAEACLEALCAARDHLLNAPGDALDWAPPRLGEFCYDSDYAEPAGAARFSAEFTLQQVLAHLAGGEASAREGRRLWLLRLLLRLRRHPALAWLARLVPFKLQRWVKRRLSRRPLHDIGS